jgi:Type I restriction-modification system methyltransferase subunit
VPPQGRADYAFFQHIAASLDPKTGRAAILLPHGVLFRRDETDLRAGLVKSDLVECVLGLGEGLFYNSPMPAAVVILRSHKPVDRRGKVLFIDARMEFVREQTQSFLHDHHQQKILSAYESFEYQEGFAAIATLDEIGDKGHSLAIPLYVTRTAMAEDTVSVIEAIDAWRTSAAEADIAIDGVLALLRREVAK